MVQRKAFMRTKNLTKDSNLRTIAGVGFWPKADSSAANWSRF